MKIPAPTDQEPATLSAELLASLGRSPFTQATVDGLRKLRFSFKSSKGKKVSARISEDLLNTVKARLNVSTDTEAMELALVNMATTDDFGKWLVGQSGSLTQDFSLEL